LSVVLLTLLGSAAMAADQIRMSGLNFLIDAPRYVGQTVEVRSCYVYSRVGDVLYCAVFNDAKARVGEIAIDVQTLDRESLRTALDAASVLRNPMSSAPSM
jgi:hypothetical protein